jgi:hypothetical protein
MKNTKVNWILGGIALLVLPLLLQSFGNAWVRIADIALLYVLLALGLNIVVGYAGLLDLGYVAFYAVGAYLFGLMASPHLADNFAAFAAMFPNGLHTSLWLVIPLAAVLAAFFGALLGAPTLKLRGDYLAIVTLGFGEIIRVFLNNLDHPVNLTNGPQGPEPDRLHHPVPVRVARHSGHQPRAASGNRQLHPEFGHPVLLPVPGAGGAERDHLPPARTVAHRPRLDGHPRRRDRGQGHGHQHAQHEAAGVRHGRHLRRCVGGDVRRLPGLRVAGIVQPDGVGDDRRHGGAGRYRPPAGRDPGRRAAVGPARGAALVVRWTCRRSAMGAWTPPSCASCSSRWP